MTVVAEQEVGVLAAPSTIPFPLRYVLSLVGQFRCAIKFSVAMLWGEQFPGMMTDYHNALHLYILEVDSAPAVMVPLSFAQHMRVVSGYRNLSGR